MCNQDEHQLNEFYVTTPILFLFYPSVCHVKLLKQISGSFYACTNSSSRISNTVFVYAADFLIFLVLSFYCFVCAKWWLHAVTLCSTLQPVKCSKVSTV